MNDLSYIGLGTAAIGRPQYINIRQESNETQSLDDFKKRGMHCLQAAYDLGIRYFDTAPGYGLAEQLIIDWLDQNEELNPDIATKWGYTYTANFDPNAEVHEVKEHSLTKLNEQWEVSKSLFPKLKYYQIHSATFESGVLLNEAVLSRLAELKEEHGLIMGLTTTGANHVEVFKKAVEIERNGKRLFDLVQVTYNIFDQSFASVFNDDSDIKVVVKEAMANGRVFPNKNYPMYQAAYEVLEFLGRKYDVGIDAIALRFCIDSMPIFKVLSGAATMDHLKGNIKAASFELEQSDVELLKSFAVPAKYYWDERKQLAWN